MAVPPLPTQTNRSSRAKCLISRCGKPLRKLRCVRNVGSVSWMASVSMLTDVSPSSDTASSKDTTRLRSPTSPSFRLEDTADAADAATAADSLHPQRRVNSSSSTSSCCRLTTRNILGFLTVLIFLSLAAAFLTFLAHTSSDASSTGVWQTFLSTSSGGSNSGTRNYESLRTGGNGQEHPPAWVMKMREQTQQQVPIQQAVGSQSAPSSSAQEDSNGVRGLLDRHNNADDATPPNRSRTDVNDHGLSPAELQPFLEHTPCINSVQGRTLIADSSGAVCPRGSVDWKGSGCCRASEVIRRLSCQGCQPDIRCCTVFENCVSCCLHPREYTETKPTPSPPIRFQACLHLCRTSSKSILNGNRYKNDDFKFCYWDEKNPLTSSSPKIDSSRLTIIAAERAISCAETCRARKMTCHEPMLEQANSCEVLKQHFECAKGCEQNFGPDQPAQVDPSSNDPNAGKCLFNSNPKYFDCSGRHANTQRLCVCIQSSST